MFKTCSANAIKIISCMKPALIHVVVPWMATEWILGLKDIGYSVINLNLEDKAFPERIRAKIKRRMETGCVLCYSAPIPISDLENLMPEEFALMWTYPNKQTDYFASIKAGCGDPYQVATANMPPGTEELWRSYLQKPNDDDLRRITKVAHEWQRKQYEIYNNENQKIMTVLL